MKSKYLKFVFTHWSFKVVIVILLIELFIKNEDLSQVIINRPAYFMGLITGIIFIAFIISSLVYLFVRNKIKNDSD